MWAQTCAYPSTDAHTYAHVRACECTHTEQHLSFAAPTHARAIARGHARDRRQTRQLGKLAVQ